MSTKPVSLAPPATLAEVMQRILSSVDLARQRRQDLMSAVRQVARLVGGMPADIPADPEALRRALSIITPAAAGMTPSRFGNVKALADGGPRPDRREGRAPEALDGLDAFLAQPARAGRRPLRARPAVALLHLRVCQQH